MLRTALADDAAELASLVDDTVASGMGWDAEQLGRWRVEPARRRWLGLRRAASPEVLPWGSAEHPLSERFTVLDQSGRRVLGFVQFEFVDRPGALGVRGWLGAPARGRGQAHHVLDALAGFAVGHLGARRLVVRIDAANRAASAVAERAAFTRREGPDAASALLERALAPLPRAAVCERLDELRPLLRGWFDAAGPTG